jgi:sec-independent protein translocase protein TatA
VFGTTEIIIIVFVILLIFGGKRLPALGAALGQSIKNLKKGMKDNDVRDVEEIDKEDKS